MAEWETAHRNVGWNREMDLELYQALAKKSLPSLAAMSRAFTQARRHSDVATAYYASGQIALFLAQTYGEDSVARVFAKLGEKQLPASAIAQVLGKSLDDLDEEFRAWLKVHLARFDSQLVSEQEPLLSQELRDLFGEHPEEKEGKKRLALALLAEGKLDESASLLDQLSEQDLSIEVAFARARVFLAQDKKEEARALFSRLVAEGHDGFEVRLFLARLCLAAEDAGPAEAHLLRATEFDPLAVEPWSLLASLAHRAGDGDAELAALEKWAQLSEHDPIVHRRLLRMLIDTNRAGEAARAAPWAVWTDLAGFETHLLAGLAHARSGNLVQAEFEWESALLTPTSPAQLATLRASWKEELVRLGFSARAMRLEQKLERLPRYSVTGASSAAPSAR
jgi:tetratricopeptide (TPR) repeat protein